MLILGHHETVGVNIMSTCLILGGNGFIGSHIAKILLKNDYNVKILSDFKSGISNIEDIVAEIEIIKGNFLDDTIIKKAVKDADSVFYNIHTTLPQSSINNPIYDVESNVIGTINLLQHLVHSDVEKIIFASSGGTVYGETTSVPVNEDAPTNPICPYGISKLAIEKYIQYFNYVYGIDYTIFRYSNPYGEGQYPSRGQGVISIFLSEIAKGKSPIIYGDGSMTRDYIYIKDLAEVNLLAISKKSKHHVFNVGSGKGTSLNDLINMMSKVVGKTIIPKYVNPRKGDVSEIVLDITRIKEEYGWEPKTSLVEGIRTTWNWIKHIV